MTTQTYDAIARTLAAFLIATLFLLVLVVASAQQQSISELRTQNISQSYSVAHKNVLNAASARKDERAESQSLDGLRKQKRTLETEKDRLELELYNRMQDVADVARLIARSKLCDGLSSPPAPGTAPDAALWSSVRDCASDGKIPPTASDQMKELLSPANNPTMLRRNADKLDRDLRRLDGDIQRSEGEVKRHHDQVTQADKVSEALEDLSVLDENGLIGPTRLTWIPPALMQIVLCFVSGLFGALLLTLILAVYPNDDFEFTTSDSYWKRIFLGGLISVAVYVVIGSSVSVLGSSRALIEDANFMSYTAIGILAGMFSERVARFLSDRGQVFAGGGAGAGAGGAGAPPPGGGNAPGAEDGPVKP